MTPILEIEELQIWAGAPGGRRTLVHGLSLTVGPGEVLGLIGESGSGKTMTAAAVLRLLPEGVEAQAAALRFMGQDMAGLDAPGFDRLRGVSMAMIFQDPAGAFNPAKTIGWHFDHTLRRAGNEGGRAMAAALLREAGVARAEPVLAQYAHQLSGGMLQRALIALVLALKPALIVADEPTTNLDAIVGRQVIALFREVQQRLRASFLYITHDLASARTFCDRIAVMYAGQVVEQGAAASMLERPRHPYSQGLLAAATELAQRPRRLQEIAGEPGAARPRNGCSFAPRCHLVHAACLERDPGLRPQADGSSVRCVLHDAA